MQQLTDKDRWLRAIGATAEHAVVTFFENSCANNWRSADHERWFNSAKTLSALAGSPQCDDGQLSVAMMEANLKLHHGTGTAAHESPRFRTRRTTWPPAPHFESWPTIGGKVFVVNLVGRATT